MEIKSNFNDVYDHIMTPLVGYTNDVLYSRQEVTKMVFQDEFEQQSDSFNIHFLNPLKQTSPKQYQISPKGVIVSPHLNRKLKNINGSEVQLPKNSVDYQVNKNYCLCILGTDVYLKETFSTVGLNDVPLVQTKVISEAYKYLGNMVEKNIDLPKWLEHKPLATISVGFVFYPSKVNSEPEWIMKHLLTDNQSYLKQPQKTYWLNANFSLVAKNNYFLTLPHYVTDDGQTDLLKIYSAIEQRLLWEREKNHKMIEVSNESKIQKAGFNQNSFRK